MISTITENSGSFRSTLFFIFFATISSASSFMMSSLFISLLYLLLYTMENVLSPCRKYLSKRIPAASTMSLILALQTTSIGMKRKTFFVNDCFVRWRSSIIRTPSSTVFSMELVIKTQFVAPVETIRKRNYLW